MTIYCVQLKSMMNVKPSVIGKYCVVQADPFKFTTLQVYSLESSNSLLKACLPNYPAVIHKGENCFLTF